MAAFRRCDHDRDSALALLRSEDACEQAFHSLYDRQVERRFGIPLAVGGLAHAVLAGPRDMPAFLRSIGDGARLDRVADRFVLWALGTYAARCAEGRAAAQRGVRAAVWMTRSRLRGLPVDEVWRVGMEVDCREAGRPGADDLSTLEGCARVAALCVFQAAPGSAAGVAVAALRSQVVVAGCDRLARMAAREVLLALLRSSPCEPG